VARDGTTCFDKEYWPAGGSVPTFPADAKPVGVLFDNGITLVAERSAESVAPDGTLALTIYWRADRPLHDDVTVSVQVLNAAGQLMP
jgi:hypothetical protein